MSLLGMPTRIPVLRRVYRMPPALYDLSDQVGHPVLVVSLDLVLKNAEVVTRTTKPYARGRRGVVHAAQPDLGLLDVGWWRLDWPKSVPFAAFADPDVDLLGCLEEQAWGRVLLELTGREGAP